VAAVPPTVADLNLELSPPSAGPMGGTALRGVVWLGGARWAAQLFAWASTLVIARLLRPEDYGLVALANAIVGLLEVVTDLGLGSALVQSRELTKRDVEATMGATCLLGLAAAVIVALSAPLSAHAVGDVRVIPVVRVLALSVFLGTALNVPYSMLHRRLAFGLVARAQFIRGTITAAVTLGAALVLQSYWALVAGHLAGKLAFTLVLIWAEPVRPRLPSEHTRVARLLRFGGILTADRILNYARSNIDIALIGAFLGTRTVGLYVMAITLARLPLEKLGSAFEPVAYPTFARLRDQMAELRKYVLNLSLGTMSIVLPACFGLIVTAGVLVPAVIGPQWNAAVRPMQVAALVTPLAFHLTLVSALFNAMGRVDLNLRITTLTSVLTIAGVVVGVRFGIVGVATATAMAFALVWVYAEALALKMIDLPVSEATQILRPPMSAALAMAISVLLMSLIVPTALPPVVRLVIDCVVGIAAYIGWALTLHKDIVVSHLRSLRAAWSTQ
jgi:teichuronic acid exporter